MLSVKSQSFLFSSVGSAVRLRSASKIAGSTFIEVRQYELGRSSDIFVLNVNGLPNNGKLFCIERWIAKLDEVEYKPWVYSVIPLTHHNKPGTRPHLFFSLQE